MPLWIQKKPARTFQNPFKWPKSLSTFGFNEFPLAPDMQRKFRDLAITLAVGMVSAVMACVTETGIITLDDPADSISFSIRSDTASVTVDTVLVRGHRRTGDH